MKVILLQEVKGRGAEGDVVEVARGFAVNYLFPRKMAIEATSGNVKQLEQRMHNVRARDGARLSDASETATKLEGQIVTISAKVGEEGRLFGSVTSAMVGDAISEQLGIDLDRRRIETHGHIKEVGEHPVDVSLYRDVKANLTVHVVGEGEIPTITVAEGVAAAEAPAAAEANVEPGDVDAAEALDPAEAMAEEAVEHETENGSAEAEAYVDEPVEDAESEF